MKNAIGIKMYTYDDYKNNEPAHLVFEITNLTKNTIHVLKWNTPLEGLQSPCLDVSSGKKIIEYDGIMKKRGLPQEKDFYTLKAGESVSTKVDLSEVYDLSKPGSFKVNFNPEKFVYYSDQTIDKAVEMSSMGFAKATKKINLDIKPTSFMVSTGTGKRITIGAMHRLEELKKKKKNKVDNFSLMANTGVLPCLVTGGTTAQKTKAKKAHKDGYILTQKALASLQKDARYIEWFGKYTKARMKRVKTNFQKVLSRLEDTQFTYDLSKTGCGSSDYAYTYKGTTTIWFCDAFWAAPANGANSKAGTVVHEHTHASSFIDDFEYGESGCLQLALTNPAKAVLNADNHEYYAEG